MTSQYSSEAQTPWDAHVRTTLQIAGNISDDTSPVLVPPSCPAEMKTLSDI